MAKIVKKVIAVEKLKEQPLAIIVHFEDGDWYLRYAGEANELGQLKTTIGDQVIVELEFDETNSTFH